MLNFLNRDETRDLPFHSTMAILLFYSVAPSLWRILLTWKFQVWPIFPSPSCSFFTSDLRVSQLIERIITSLLVIGLDLQDSRFDTSWYVLAVIIGLQQFDALPNSYFILCNFDSIELVHLRCWINVTIDHLRWLIQNDSHRFKWLRL